MPSALLNQDRDGLSGAAARRRVLVVDDDPDIVHMISVVLRRDFEVVTAPDGRAALSQLGDGSLDAVVADHMMPGVTGVELLDALHRAHPAAARVLITASERVNVLKEAVNRARVHRFLSKPLRLVELPNLMHEAIREARLEAENTRLTAELLAKNAELARINERLEMEVALRTQELRAAVAELERMALRDGLTGLYNHRYFQEALEAELARARRHGHSLSLVFIDVDHFKQYNDRNGHPAGDRLLHRLAGVLTGGRDSGLPPVGRASDVTARYGGEEFVVILPETGLDGALVKAERLRDSVAEHPFEHGAAQPAGAVTISVGVACFPHHAENKAELIAAADQQLYRAKRAGRNRVCVLEE